MDQSAVPVDTMLNGASKFEATKLDGTSETVSVRLVAVRELGRYLTLVDDIAAFADFVINKPKGWADTLTDDALYGIDALARKLNDPRLDRFLTRQMEAVERMKPMANKVNALTSTLPTP